MIAIVVAKANNNVIGSHNDLPWYLPADLKNFKKLTIEHTVIMGRKTFESIYKRLNGPLPDRRNIVITTSLPSLPAGFELATSPEQALAITKTDDIVYLIGGATIYDEFLKQGWVDEVYLTEVHADIPGDTYFSDLGDNWQEIGRESHHKDDKNPYDYDFVHLKKVR